MLKLMTWSTNGLERGCPFGVANICFNTSFITCQWGCLSNPCSSCKPDLVSGRDYMFLRKSYKSFIRSNQSNYLSHVISMPGETVLRVSRLHQLSAEFLPCPVQISMQKGCRHTFTWKQAFSACKIYYDSEMIHYFTCIQGFAFDSHQLLQIQALMEF